MLFLPAELSYRLMRKEFIENTKHLPLKQVGCTSAKADGFNHNV